MYQTGNKLLQIKYKHKEERSPESLFCLCLKYIARNLNVICEDTPTGYKLHSGLQLPSDICDPFIKTYQNNGGQMSDGFASLFKDITMTKLTSVHIDHSNITDNDFAYLLRHDLKKLSIINCLNLTKITYLNIFNHCVNLQSLTIDPNEHYTTTSFNRKMLKKYSFILDASRIILRPNPNLKHLVLGIVPESPSSGNNMFLSSVFGNYLGLRVLDLSYCLDVGTLLDISNLHYLHTLILFNVRFLKNYSETILNICTLTSLVVLDMSQTTCSVDHFLKTGVYEDENKTLALIVKCLPNLMYLDISGTDLAGKGTSEYSPCKSLSDKKSDIPGLQSRVDNPLEFLGLYNTMYNACRRHNIPAKIISGDADEIQLFNAAASCMHKPTLLHCILDDLYNLLEHSECTHADQALDIILEALARNVRDGSIFTNGSIFLFNIVNEKRHFINSITIKTRIITTLIAGMKFHKYNAPVNRIGYLTLYHLDKL